MVSCLQNWQRARAIQGSSPAHGDKLHWHPMENVGIPCVSSWSPAWIWSKPDDASCDSCKILRFPENLGNTSGILTFPTATANGWVKGISCFPARALMVEGVARKSNQRILSRNSGKPYRKSFYMLPPPAGSDGPRDS